MIPEDTYKRAYAEGAECGKLRDRGTPAELYEEVRRSLHDEEMSDAARFWNLAFAAGYADEWK